MDISVITNAGMTIFSKASGASFFNWWFYNVMRGPSLLLHFGSVIFWIVLGIIMAKNARKVGSIPVIHFLLCFFLHFVGLIISVIVIDKCRKSAMRDRFRNCGQPFNAQYQQPQPFYPNSNYNGQQTQGYRPQCFNPFNGVNPTKPNTSDIYCPNCGTAQDDGVFCRICGTRIR